MRKNTNAPIQNEANNGLSNKRGSIAMARTSDPHSATAQFFINVADNTFLDHRAKELFGKKVVQEWGYAVFGEVVEGMDVVDKIKVCKLAIKVSTKMYQKTMLLLLLSLLNNEFPLN
ncbi:peptidyl-prolyl cis-trans isomerase B [Pasteurella canis]|uniref:peptidylprolyl isomerase n=1 Tax=Pasteurella canis TaxID=753 RepID=A0A379ES56_9PAST|nr:peptidyl-prolyl cis-trans isomerase B [Pasteurella canis]